MIVSCAIPKKILEEAELLHEIIPHHNKHLSYNITSNLSHMIRTLLLVAQAGILVLLLFIGFSNIRDLVQKSIRSDERGKSEIINKRENISRGIICAGCVLTLYGVVWQRIKVYIDDSNKAELYYYSSLISLYDMVRAIPDEVHDHYQKQIEEIYQSLPNYVQKFVSQKIEIRKNNIWLSSIHVILMIYTICIVYDSVRYITLMGSDHMLKDELICDKILPVITDNTDYEYIIEEIQAQIDQVEESIRNTNVQPEYQDSVIIHHHNEEPKDIKYTGSQLFLTLKLLLIFEDKDLKDISSILGKIRSMAIYKTDRIYMAIISGLVMSIIVMMYVMRRIQRNRLDDEEGPSYNQVVQDMLNNYTIYTVYSLQSRYQAKHTEILDDEMKKVRAELIPKLVAHLVITGIFFSIVVLVLNRKMSVKGLIFLSSQLTKMTDEQNFAMGLGGLISLGLLMTFLVAMKLYIIFILQSMLMVFKYEVDNQVSEYNIDKGFNLLISLGIPVSSRHHSFQFGGTLKFINTARRDDQSHRSLTLTIPPQKVTMIYCHPLFKIDNYIDMIRQRHESIYVTNQDGQDISLSTLTEADLNAFMSYNDEYPSILFRTLEENIWVGVEDEQVTPYHISLMKTLVNLSSLYQSYGAYINSNKLASQNSSGGERQRISIIRPLARAIVNTEHAHLLLFNQSFSAIDYGNVKHIIDNVKRIQQNHNIAMCIISTQPEHFKLADNIIYIDANGHAHYYDNDQQIQRIMNSKSQSQ